MPATTLGALSNTDFAEFQPSMLVCPLDSIALFSINFCIGPAHVVQPLLSGGLHS
jgi:hypothetical protein